MPDGDQLLRQHHIGSWWDRSPWSWAGDSCEGDREAAGEEQEYEHFEVLVYHFLHGQDKREAKKLLDEGLRQKIQEKFDDLCGFDEFLEELDEIERGWLIEMKL